MFGAHSVPSFCSWACGVRMQSHRGLSGTNDNRVYLADAPRKPLWLRYTSTRTSLSGGYLLLNRLELFSAGCLVTEKTNGIPAPGGGDARDPRVPSGSLPSGASS